MDVKTVDLSPLTFQARNLHKFLLALPFLGSIKRKRKRLGSQGRKMGVGRRAIGNGKMLRGTIASKA